MRHLAVLLTVHNRKLQTLECLRQLFRQSLPSDVCLSVFLTDDGCTDGTPESVSLQFPQVTIIQGDGKLYWNQGMIAAWKQAVATRPFDFYLWLNDDTLLCVNALVDLLNASSRYLDKAIIVGATQSSDHSHITYGGRMIDGSFHTPDGTETRCNTFDGNIVLVPKSAYDAVGMLDPYYSHSGGDTDYGLTATRQQIAIYQVGHYLGTCDTHPTLSTWCNPKIPLHKRIRALYQPNGQPPHELFHLESKFYGVPTALFHYFTTHLHCLIPQLWQWLGKAKH